MSHHAEVREELLLATVNDAILFQVVLLQDGFVAVKLYSQFAVLKN